MRLIDADALIERLDDFNKWCKDERLQGSLFVVNVVGDMPTVCEIPKNATNGDVIRTLFKPSRVERTDDDVIIENYDFNKDWWNSPYKR